MNASAQHVIDDFDQYLSLLRTRGLDALRYEFKTSVVREIIRSRSIDTARMITAVDTHSEVISDFEYSFHVDTSSNPEVFYDGFVDQPAHNRDGSVRSGRFFYQKGIENADIESAFNEIAQESFVI